MKKYYYPSFIYFARYVLKVISGKDMSLQTLDSVFRDWEKNCPNEVEEVTEMTVDEQLAIDMKLTGKAYYRLIDGKKFRIPPAEIVIMELANKQ